MDATKSGSTPLKEANPIAKPKSEPSVKLAATLYFKFWRIFFSSDVSMAALYLTCGMINII
jgi:hypothetical protein